MPSAYVIRRTSRPAPEPSRHHREPAAGTLVGQVYNLSAGKGQVTNLSYKSGPRPGRTAHRLHHTSDSARNPPVGLRRAAPSRSGCRAFGRSARTSGNAATDDGGTTGNSFRGTGGVRPGRRRPVPRLRAGGGVRRDVRGAGA